MSIFFFFLQICLFYLLKLLFCSKIYRVQTICHDNLDDQYIDGIKMVYIQVDSVTRVDAVCDYKSKKSNSSNIKCAGAAEITFQVKK